MDTGGRGESNGDFPPTRGGVYRRSHTRSASHGGTLWSSHDGGSHQSAPVTASSNNDAPPSSSHIPLDEIPALPNPRSTSILMNPSPGGSSASLPGHTQRTHQRTFSHGQSVEGMTGPHYRGHKRAGSKTDFILPDGHKEREEQQTKQQVGRTSSFPLGHRRNASKTESIYTIRENKVPLLQRLMFWKKPCDEQRSRTVVANHVLSPHNANPNDVYPCNKIRTAKYTLISFIPKNLFEQFHRVANLYFLFIVLLNFVPSINAFAKEIAMLPLIFVLSVTACKDLFEDRRRYQSDRKVNNATCRVYNSIEKRYVRKAWKDVRVGDIVHLSCNEVIPADIVLLNTSDPLGVCYIESSNLDGETTLKQRQSVKGLGMDEMFDVSKYDSVLEICPPTTKIYHFLGSIPMRDGSRVPLNETNLILRSCIVKNTDFVEGIVVYAGPETKAMLNNGGCRHKRSLLERCMNTAVLSCVGILFFMCFLSATGSGIWQSYYESSALNGTVPFLPPLASRSTGVNGRPDELLPDPSQPAVRRLYNRPGWVAFLAFWTYIIIYQVIIPIALYVTVEIVKLFQVYHIHQDEHFSDNGSTIECRATNITEDLGQIQYVFTDKTGTLTENNMVFQRCSIGGVDYEHEPVLEDDSSESRCHSFSTNPKLYHELSSSSAECDNSVHLCSHQPHRAEHFFLTLVLCNTVVVAKTPHKDKMTAKGVMPPPAPSEEDSTQSSTPMSFLKSFPPFSRMPPAPDRLKLRTLNLFSRPLSPIASSPTASPEVKPRGADHNPLSVVLSSIAETSSTTNIAPNNAANLSSIVEDSSIIDPVMESSRIELVSSEAASHNPASSSFISSADTAVNFSSASLCTTSGSAANIDSTLQVGGATLDTNCNISSSSFVPPVIVSQFTSPSSPSSQSRPNFLNLSCSPTATCGDTVPLQEDASFKPIYEAESPDELALVHAAGKYGVKLMRRSAHFVRIELQNKGAVDYELLHIFPFDSTRKRMSVIVRHPITRQLILYCKGADSAILNVLQHQDDQLKQFQEFRTQQHLHRYSKCGLRTLCIAMRVLRESDYTRWLREYREAEAALSDRAYKLQSTYKKMERDLVLLGATGIEDRLQDGVPETLSCLRSAGMVVWLLTGDKQETAINVAYSASLFTQTMKILKLNARTKEQAENMMKLLLEQVTAIDNLRDNDSVLTAATTSTGVTAPLTAGSYTATGSASLSSDNKSTTNFSIHEDEEDTGERGLVVDGKTLVFILDKRTELLGRFLELSKHCNSVLISRATPLQKALVVKLTKQSLNVVTLAVGDGANDVSMIQTADVGVGISGVEGRQAVMASDFAISKFSHLHRLLLVHGHLSYYRLATIILYFFYKNANLVLVLLWFQFYSGFSGNNFIDPNYLIQFGLTFTSVPPIILGVYDNNIPASVLFKEPSLYRVGRERTLYNNSYFWVNILDGMYQSLVMFFSAALAYGSNPVCVDELGITVIHNCLIGQLLHIALETRSWTLLHVAVIVLSVLVFQLFGVIYTMTCVSCFGTTSLYGVWSHLMSSPVHWLVVLLSAVTALLPRVVYKVYKAELNPSEVQQALRKHKQLKYAQRRGVNKKKHIKNLYRQRSEREGAALQVSGGDRLPAHQHSDLPPEEEVSHSGAQQPQLSPSPLLSVTPQCLSLLSTATVDTSLGSVMTEGTKEEEEESTSV